MLSAIVTVVVAEVVAIVPAILFWPSTENVPALVSVTAALVPPATVLVTVIVQTVFEVCATEIELMFAVKVKSSPAVLPIVEQSIVPVVAVTVKVLVLVVPEAELAAKAKTGVVASTAMVAVVFKTAVAGSPAAVEPYSTTMPEL